MTSLEAEALVQLTVGRKPLTVLTTLFPKAFWDFLRGPPSKYDQDQPGLANAI